MPRRPLAATFQQVDECDLVAVDIVVRVCERMPDAGLSGHVQNEWELVVAKQCLDTRPISKVELVEFKAQHSSRASRSSLRLTL